MSIYERIIPILALIISLLSAFFSYVQSRTSAEQYRLTAQQLRPHISYVPTFFRKNDGLYVDLYVQNRSPLPANVLFTDTAVRVGDDVLEHNFYSASPDIINQEMGGLSSLPPFEGKLLTRIEKGNEALTLATCVIYASTTNSDSRRWRLRTINEYIPGESLPSRLFIQEDEIDPFEKTCPAKGVFKLL